VLSRLDAVARGVEALAGMRHVDPGAYLIDPAVCAATPPPRLHLATPELRIALATGMRESVTLGRTKQETTQTLVEQVKREPCAAAFAHMFAATTGTPAERERRLADAASDAERCDDERVRAEIALTTAALAFESAMLGTTITSKLKLAEVASQRVSQPDVAAAIEGLRSEVARRADQLTEAIARAESAMQGYAARNRIAAELGQGLAIIKMRLGRATPEDLAAIQPTLDAWRLRAVERLGADDDIVRAIDMTLANWQFHGGDVAGATATLERLYRPEPNEPARRIKGRVVDRSGAPVGGARVVAGKRIDGNQHTIALAADGGLRYATTGPDGTFEIADASEIGAIIAQHGELRSRPIPIADTVTLKLEPTSLVEGRVELAGHPPVTVVVVATDPTRPEFRATWATAVTADGTFALGGLPRGTLRVFTAIEGDTTRTGIARTLHLKTPTIRGIVLTVPSTKRVIHVLVRSTVGAPVVNGAVLVISGKVLTMSARELRKGMTGINERAARQLEGEHAPAAVVAQARAGDLFATMSDVPEGAASACAIALPADLADPTLNKKVETNLDKLILQCVPIPEKAEVVVVEVPPFPRLD
ncbi:MAG: carboxypeptidase regulatory-like domain-containing protein, partial [Deltaproteobacteria bacterium]|nr:carboxypeptidase regulatory-like domain-containing protein [Deltaproteobacteria bacterium]